MIDKRLLILILVSAMMIGGCDRPGGGLRDRFQEQDEATQAGPVELPDVETQATGGATDLMDDLDALLGDLDRALYAELEWQLDIPDETSLQGVDLEESEAVLNLLDDLVDSLQSLDDTLVEESGQQVDLP